MDGMDVLEALHLPQNNNNNPLDGHATVNPAVFALPSESKTASRSDNIQDVFHAAFSASNNNALEVEFSAAISQQLKKFRSVKGNKRDGCSITGSESNSKRPRSNDDDDFVNLLLADDFHSEQTTNAGQDTSNEVQQQKDALLRWFSERMFQVENTAQNMMDDQAQVHKEEIATLKRQHAEELQHRQQTISGVQLDEIDTGRLNRADQEYSVVRQGISDALMQTDSSRYSRLLMEASVKYDRFKESIKEELLLMRCRHLNERRSDQTKLLDLAAQHKLLKEHHQELIQRQNQRGEQYPVFNQGTQQSATAELTQLQASYRRQVMEMATLKQEHVKVTNLLEGFKIEVLKMTANLQELQKAYGRQSLEVATLKPQAAEAATLRQLNELLTRQNSLMKHVNSSAQMDAIQAQVGMLQQTTKMSNHTINQAQAAQAECDESLKKQKEANDEELRKIIKNHMGQMKGQRLRMENLAERIKTLSFMNQDKSETMHEMAEEINTLKTQVERLRNGMEETKQEY